MEQTTQVISRCITSIALLCAALSVSSEPAESGAQCFPALNESQRYVSSVVLDFGTLNDLKEREAIISALSDYKQILDRCDVRSTSRTKAESIAWSNAYAAFTEYRSDFGSLLMLVNVKNLEMPPGYVEIVARTAERVVTHSFSEIEGKTFSYENPSSGPNKRSQPMPLRGPAAG